MSSFKKRKIDITFETELPGLTEYDNNCTYDATLPLNWNSIDDRPMDCIEENKIESKELTVCFKNWNIWQTQFASILPIPEINNIILQYISAISILEQRISLTHNKCVCCYSDEDKGDVTKYAAFISCPRCCAAFCLFCWSNGWIYKNANRQFNFGIRIKDGVNLNYYIKNKAIYMYYFK